MIKCWLGMKKIDRILLKAWKALTDVLHMFFQGNYCVLCLRNLHWTVLGHEIFKGPNLTLAVVQISNPSAATL